MPDDVPENYAREIWLNQPTEPSEMTLGKLLLRQKARELHAKTCQELFKNIGRAFVVLAMSAFGITWTDDPAARAAFTLAAAWALAGQYFLNRGMWLAPLPGDAALTTGLEFYRREVEGRHRLFRNLLRWGIGPVIPALAAFIWTTSGKGPMLKMAPFLALLAIWIVSMIVVRVRGEREFQREIDELNHIESESGIGPVTGKLS